MGFPPFSPNESRWHRDAGDHDSLGKSKTTRRVQVVGSSLMIEPRFGCAEIPWWSFWVAVSSAHRRVFNPQRAWVWVQQLVLMMCSYMLENSVLWLGWKNYWGDFVEWFTFNVFRFDCKDQVIAWSAGALPGRNLGIESRILGTHGFGRVFETGK